jgi:hypothetical protein
MKVRDFSSLQVGPVGRSFNFSPSSSHHSSRALSGAASGSPKGESEGEETLAASDVKHSRQNVG